MSNLNSEQKNFSKLVDNPKQFCQRFMTEIVKNMDKPTGPTAYELMKVRNQPCAWVNPDEQLACNYFIRNFAKEILNHLEKTENQSTSAKMSICDKLNYGKVPSEDSLQTFKEEKGPFKESYSV